MHQGAGAANPLIGYVITAVVVTIVLAIRLRRVNQSRPLKVERLWIIPALYAALAVTMFVVTPPSGLGWVLSAAALAIGAALGWQRGRMIRIEVDPETHRLSARQSPAAFIFIVVLILFRSGMRAILESGGGAWLHVNAATLTDVLVALALGLLGVQRLEMYLRARRLLQDSARA